MIRRSILALLTVLLIHASALAQQHDSDAAAMAAFEAMVDSYRERPSLTVRTSVDVSVGEGEQTGQGDPVEAEFILGPRPHGIVKLRGYTVYLGSGDFLATHESNDSGYFSTPDDGSPYYTLLNAFLDIPFPHLAMQWGEDEMEWLCMQFHPKAPFAVPTAVGEVEEGGRTLQRITMTSDFDTMHIDVDPATGLMERVELMITGGDLAQAGATIRYEHTFEYETHDEELDESVFTLEVGNLQRSDMMSSIVIQPEPDPVDMPGVGGGPEAPQLVGNPAPPLVLATVDGKAINLEEMRGQVVVIDFWATWCQPCKKALPRLHDIADWIRDEQLPATIITVNVWEIPEGPDNTPDERNALVEGFWKKHGFTLPVAMDYTDQVGDAFQVSGIPTTVIVRSDGIVHAEESGVSDDYTEVLKGAIMDAIAAVEGD